MKDVRFRPKADVARPKEQGECLVKHPSLVIAFTLLGSSTVANAGGVRAQDLLAEIDKDGGSEVVRELISHPSHGDWDFVLGQIATGDAEWLKVADKIGETIDLGSDNELPILGIDDALARALPRAPDGVLSLLGKSYKPINVCGLEPHNATKAEALQAVSASIAALSASGRGSANEATKDLCLKQLRALQSSLNKWTNDPPEELVAPIRTLGELLGDGYTQIGWNGMEYLKYSGRGPSANGDQVDPGYVVLFNTEGEGGGNGSTQYLAYFTEATSGGYWTVKSYVLNSYIAIGGRGWRTLKLTSVDDKVIRLTGKAQTNSDAMCCPSRPVTIGVKIMAEGLTYANTADAD